MTTNAVQVEMVMRLSQRDLGRRECAWPSMIRSATQKLGYSIMNHENGTSSGTSSTLTPMRLVYWYWPKMTPVCTPTISTTVLTTTVMAKKTSAHFQPSTAIECSTQKTTSAIDCISINGATISCRPASSTTRPYSSHM